MPLSGRQKKGEIALTETITNLFATKPNQLLLPKLILALVVFVLCICEIFVPLLFALLAWTQKYLRKEAKVSGVKEKFHAYGCLCPFFPHNNGMPINNISGTIPKVTGKKSCLENKMNSQIFALKTLVNNENSLSIAKNVKKK